MTRKERMQNKKYTIGICGYFDSSLVGENGQTIRTKSITRKLIEHYGDSKIHYISTHNWKEKPFALLIELIKLCRTSNSVLLFPDMRAIKVVLPICILLKPFCNTKVYYNVVGGWLPTKIEKNALLKYFVKKADALFIQTSTLKKELSDIGINNTVVFPNFKMLRKTDDIHLNQSFTIPLPCCFFSRITEFKGLDELVSAIIEINTESTKITLDIYGFIDDKYKNHFNSLMEMSPTYIRYMGEVRHDKSVDILENYYLQVFPTKYKTEGHPGSLIDSLYAGLPVLASRWDSWCDVVIENETGITYEFNQYADLKNKLIFCIEKVEQITQMRQKCLTNSDKYSPDSIMKIMYNVIDNK